MSDQPKKIPRHKLLQIAGKIPADPATVRKVLEGRPVRGSIRDRVKDELVSQGYMSADDDGAGED